MNWEYSVIRYLHHLWSDTVLSESGFELVVHVYFKFQDKEYKNFQEVSRDREHKSQSWRIYLQKACLIKDCYPKYTKNS